MNNAFHRLHTLRMANQAMGETMQAMKSRFDSLKNRHTEGTAPKALSAFQLFQTPASLASRMVDLAGIVHGQSVLEPSAGLGNLIIPILAAGGRVTACEIDTALAGEIFQRFLDVSLWQGDFLQRDPVPSFDHVIMNPPFHMRSDIAHVKHALRFLRSGGSLVGLCMSTHHRETALKHLSSHWEIIPSGTFREAGTQVETILFKITI